MSQLAGGGKGEGLESGAQVTGAKTRPGHSFYLGRLNAGY